MTELWNEWCAMPGIFQFGFGLGAFAALLWLFGVRYIPHSKVGIIEKLWSMGGSLEEGRIIALDGEAGIQADILRGGLHFGYSPLKYCIHKTSLVTISEGRIGYVYARDGQPLAPTQTLGQLIESHGFQNARAFLMNQGQRGRQRGILREGVYAMNNALFVVIAENQIYAGPMTREEAMQCGEWREELVNSNGFSPVIVGCVSGANGEPEVSLSPGDQIGIVTVHDGPTLPSGEIIAPEVMAEGGHTGHNYFQDPEAFLALNGIRGKQLQVLTDGTYFINRWFATVEMRPKTLIPIGYVGVVISYFGNKGSDVTGDTFRYGEQVESGNRGVWRQALPPGKYALNPYALKVELVPTVNFVLRWVTGQTEQHRYDEELTSIALITADGYEPLLPLSLVLHIDYEKAPRVIQRFGDVKRLISQTLDPILTAYFRDIAQGSHMLDLLTQREQIQKHATDELGRRFKEFDINCVAVLIGRPESQKLGGEEDPIQRLFDQLRERRLAEEQKETFSKQQEAAHQLKELNNARAAADKQNELTQTEIDVRIAHNRGESQRAEAMGLAQRDIARAEGEARSRELLGRGEATKIGEVGAAEANVFYQKIQAYGDPRLFALSLVMEQLSKSQQPLVPQSMMWVGGEKGGGEATPNLLQGLLYQLLNGQSDWKLTPPTTVATPEVVPPVETQS
ncbi:MAG: SPFH domain-containing protein [Verrucomicrobiota bacterium]